MKVFISQPMIDKTDDDILKEREKAIERIKKEYNNVDVKIINSFIEESPDDATPIWYFAKSISFLVEADIAYFIGEWRNYRGCKLENLVAREYGIKVIEE